MTHAEALRDDHQHFPGRGCPGELAETDRHADRRIAATGPVACTVVLYRCPECGCCLSIEHESGVVRNCYPGRPAELVRDLARDLDARPFLPIRRED